MGVRRDGTHAALTAVVASAMRATVEKDFIFGRQGEQGGRGRVGARGGRNGGDVSLIPLPRLIL